MRRPPLQHTCICRLAWATTSDPNKEFRQGAHDEVNIMKSLSHSHIAKLCGSYVLQSKNRYALLMQPVADMNLSAYLEKCSREGYPATMLEPVSVWLACLINALDYMHTRKVKHRDIKPHNILVRGNVVYITDFGSARDWSLYETCATRTFPIGYTRKYQAPEVELISVPEDEDENHFMRRSEAADVFSLGCTFAEMVTVMLKRLSIHEFDKYRSEKCDGKDCFDQWVVCDDSDLDSWMESWTAGSSIYADLLKDMMAKDDKQRPSSRDLVTRLENGLSGGFGPLVCSHRPSTTDRA